MRQSVTLVYFD